MLTEKRFDILVINLNNLHNYFNDVTKLLSDLYLKFLTLQQNCPFRVYMYCIYKLCIHDVRLNNLNNKIRFDKNGDNIEGDVTGLLKETHETVKCYFHITMYSWKSQKR